MPRGAHEASNVILNAATSACAEAKQWQEALRLPFSMAVPSIVALTVLMSSFRELLWQWPLVLLNGFKGLQFNILTHNAAIATFERAALWQSASCLLQRALEQGLELEAASYNSSISSCSQAAWPEALLCLRALGSLDASWNPLSKAVLKSKAVRAIITIKCSE